jgi:hypothetical protein
MVQIDAPRAFLDLPCDPRRWGRLCVALDACGMIKGGTSALEKGARAAFGICAVAAQAERLGKDVR